MTVQAERVTDGWVRLTVGATTLMLSDEDVPGRPPVTPTVDWSPVAPLASPHGCIVYVTGDTAGTGHGLEPGTEVRVADYSQRPYELHGDYLVTPTGGGPRDRRQYLIPAADLDVAPPSRAWGR